MSAAKPTLKARAKALAAHVTGFFRQTMRDDGDAHPEIRIGVAVLAGFFVLFLGWAAFAPLDAAVVAPGVVMVSGDRQTVQHRDGGVVSRLAVIEGQQVQSGQILIELAATELIAQERALTSQFIEYETQRARLAAEGAGLSVIAPPPEWASMSEEDRAQANTALARHQQEMSARTAALHSDRGVLRQREGQLSARIAGYKEQIAATEHQQALLGDELSGLNTLREKGLVPLTRVRSVEGQIAELDGRKAELRAAIAQAEQGIGETRLQSTGVDNSRRKDDAEELRQVDMRLSEVAPQLASVREQLERTRLRAPAAGKVVALAVHTIGGVVRPGERVLDIVPTGQALVIQAQVRPEDADDLHVGQRAEVRITAFSGRDMPILFGTVREVSADRFTDERTGRAYFLAQVEAPTAEVSRLRHDGKAAGPRLSAGLPAEMIAVTRKRTALQYLLEPLNQAMWRSFREG